MHRVIVAFLISAILFRPALAGSLSSETAQTTASQVTGTENKTILDGVYTAAQAARGKEAFAMHCSSCHLDDLSGSNGPTLKGATFIENWREDSLNALHSLIKTTMPRGRQKLNDDAYTDILAYILDRNEYPSGSNELKAETVGTIRFVGKNGPAPVPEYSLVQVVGCLTEGSDGAWLLTKATDPIRTRNPEKPTPEELNAAGVKPLGIQTFRLVYPDFTPSFRVDDHKGHKMEGKGYLLINPVDQRLSVTWLGTVAPDCNP